MQEYLRKYLGALFFLVLLAGPAPAFDATYVSRTQIPLAKLLAPPPEAQSAAQKRDIDEVLRLQSIRTPQQAEKAVADNSTSMVQVVGDVLGPAFTQDRLPKLDAFYKRLHLDSRDIFFASKDVWNRPRPYAASAEVQAVGEKPQNGSYPSGHSTRGYLTAIILANMVPEKSAELFARGREYGDNRVLAGVHYPTDVEAGRMGATAVAAAFMQNAAFMKDFADAKAELRQALGLPPQ